MTATTTTVKSPCFSLVELLDKPEAFNGVFTILKNRIKQDGGTVENVELVKLDHQADEWIGLFKVTLAHYV